MLQRILASCLLVLLVAADVAADPKRIAITFDDAPRVDSAYFDGATRTAKLLAALEAAKVGQVAFFCNSTRIDAGGAARIKSYAQAGHLIANHSHSHGDLHRVGAEAFLADVKAADEALRGFPNYRQWFRYPYLHEGRTLEERDVVRDELRKSQCLSAYVTVDTYDWHMDALLQEAVRAGKAVAFERLRGAYVDLLTDSIEFYDGIARDQLGRSPSHVLLLHENDLAALYIGDLVTRLRSRGWEIISPEEAYRDPIAAVAPDTLMLGQGRVIAMAVEKGYRGPRGRWEDEEKLKLEFQRRRVWE